jgi:peptidoglycan/xylan/chitin deacetylase (PgdA/CDA1 family)
VVGGISRRVLGLEFDDLMAVGCPVERLLDPPEGVALTFDDGPSAHSTPRVLDALERHDVRATFFLLGVNTRAHRAIARDIAGRGHALGCHGDQHLDYHWARPARIAEDLRRAKASIEDASGVAVRMARAPYLHFRFDLGRLARRAGLTRLIGASVVTPWDEPSAERLAAFVEARLTPGANVLLHDRTALDEADTGGWSSTVVRALDGIVSAVRARGARFRLPDEGR